MSEPLPNSAPSDGRSGLLWAALALVLGLAIGAGAWSALARRERGTAGTPPSAAATGGETAGVLTGGGPGPLAVGKEVLPFSLTERSGRPVRRADLDGKVWIANFIFTRCSNVCPDLTRKMAAVRTKLAEHGADDIVSVSFSVDPAYDTPAVLAGYASAFHADRASWLFLTGEPKDLLHIVNDGFQLAMANPTSGPPAHSNRFVLVDAKGRMRSTHLGTDEGVVDIIVKEALALRKEVRG